MSLPIHLHSGLMGAPLVGSANGSLNAMLRACLVDGFNAQAVSSATASGGVVTFNFATDPGFPAQYTVQISGASNALVNGNFRVQSAASNQVLVAIPDVPDGAVGGTIYLKFAPLGWTRPYSGTGLGAYRQGGTSAVKRYLRVRDSATNTNSGYAYWRGYEAMTAISSGTGPFPTTAQVAGDGLMQYGPNNGATQAPWLLVGTPRTFYLQTSQSYQTVTGDFNTVDPYGNHISIFGDLDRPFKAGDAYACVVKANEIAVGSMYLPRRHTGASGAVLVDAWGLSGGNTFGGLNTPYPDPASGGLALGDSPMLVESDTSALRGYLPGVLAPWNSPILSLTLPPGTVFTNVGGVTGRALLMGPHSNHAASALVALLDEDWGDV